MCGEPVPFIYKWKRIFLFQISLSAFPSKIPVTRILFFLIFSLSRNIAPKLTEQSYSNSIFREFLQLSTASPFHFRPTLNIKATLMSRVVHIRNKKRTDWQTWNFTNMINCFCCYVIKSAEEIAKKVLLSIFWNLLLIEINLSQIRITDSKREKVCVVCPYLLFYIFVPTYVFIFAISSSASLRQMNCLSPSYFPQFDPIFGNYKERRGQMDVHWSDLTWLT